MSELENAAKPAILNSGYYDLAWKYLAGYLHPQMMWQKKKYDTNQIIAEINKRLAGNDYFRQIVLGSILEAGLKNSYIDPYVKDKHLFDPYLQAFIKEPLVDHRNKIENDFKNRHNLSDITFKKLNGTPAQGMVDSIRAAHKGKVVYIDFWATWCGPCLGEMPYARKLQQELNNPDVVFVSICMDSNKKLWQKYIAEHDMTGEQYFATGKQAGAMRQTFGITGIPHHVLIDKNGDIVESGIYLRPGILTQKKITALLGKQRTEERPLVAIPAIK
jgi:thiol-disulfide isomerase/thioredoxin